MILTSPWRKEASLGQALCFASSGFILHRFDLNQIFSKKFQNAVVRHVCKKVRHVLPCLYILVPHAKVLLFLVCLCVWYLHDWESDLLVDNAFEQLHWQDFSRQISCWAVSLLHRYCHCFRRPPRWPALSMNQWRRQQKHMHSSQIFQASPGWVYCVPIVFYCVLGSVFPKRLIGKGSSTAPALQVRQGLIQHLR